MGKLKEEIIKEGESFNDIESNMPENKKYKAEIRIPTIQYGYVNLEMEGTLEEVRKAHDEAQAYFGNKGVQNAPAESVNIQTAKDVL